MEDAGDIIFSNLALLFAIGVAIGLAADGAAGLAAIFGYLVLNRVMSSWVGVTPVMVESDPGFASVLGIPTLQTSVSGGILDGLLATFHDKQLHKLAIPYLF